MDIHRIMHLGKNTIVSYFVIIYFTGIKRTGIRDLLYICILLSLTDGSDPKEYTYKIGCFIFIKVSGKYLT